MLADYADACNRGACHVVGGFTGLSVPSNTNIHTDKLSRRFACPDAIYKLVL
jgi:hypothetical protein